MTYKNQLKLTGLISGILIALMLIFRHAKSELFTVLSVLLGATLFYSLLYRLFETEQLKFNTSFTKVKYIFFAISIPALVYGVEVTRASNGLLKEGIRVMLALEVLYLLFYWGYQYRKSIQQLKSDKLEAELVLLKNQINPHFFFNTLNNLYALIKNDADTAQDYVLKLSELMRFTIYESGKDQVKLADEITYLLNYIDLQSSRYHKTVDVNVDTSIEDTTTKIAPLLIINLLENAFKHGIEKATDEAFVHMQIHQDAKGIKVSIKNNFEDEDHNISQGIGLNNLKRRLNLIYPQTHHLSHQIEDDTYTATLEITTK